MYTDYTENNDNELDTSYYEDKSNNNFDKEKIKKIAIIVLAFVVGLILIVSLVKGCSKDNNGNGVSVGENQKEPVIALNTKTKALQIGDEFQLIADIFYTKEENPVVKWQSEDTSIVVVDDEGHIIAVGEGETNIVSYYEQDGVRYQDTCLVTVTEKTVEIESIEIAQDDFNLKIGESVLLQVNVLPVTAKVGNLVFSSDDSTIATVSESGIVNAIKEGTTAIVVKTEDGNFSDSIMVTVSKDEETLIPVNSILMVGLTNGLTIGNTAEIVYVVNPSNATNTELIWTSSNQSVATVENAVITGVSAGKATIIATAPNGVTGQLEVEVSPDKVLVERVEIDGETSITMNLGGTKKINHKINPENATNQNVTYTTSNNSILLIDSNGMIAAVGTGTAVVTVQSVDDPTKTAFINVTVKDENGNTTSGEGSESTSGDLKCLPGEMISITHNSKGSAVVSSVQFSNATAFTSKSIGTPTITIEDLKEDCIGNSVKAYVYYGSTQSNINESSSVKSYTGLGEGSTIELSEGNGYYKIKVVDNSNTLTKWYYAIVNISGNTSGSSSSDSGNGSSSSDSGGGSSESNNGGGSSSSKTCNKATATTITHNYTGKDPNLYGTPKIYGTEGHESAYKNPFPAGANIGITFTNIDENCTINSRIYYTVYHGQDTSNMSKKEEGYKTENETILISKATSGYYKITIRNSKKDIYLKDYWFYVRSSSNSSTGSTGSTSNSTGSNRPLVNSITVSKSSNQVKLSITPKGSYIKTIKYCRSTSGFCTPLTTKNISVNSLTQFNFHLSLTNMSKFKYMCAQVVDYDNNESERKCVEIE